MIASDESQLDVEDLRGLQIQTSRAFALAGGWKECEAIEPSTKWPRDISALKMATS